MILDDLRRAVRYAALHPGLPCVFAFLRDAPEDIADGRHEIEGERIYANVMSYETKPAATLVHEAHRRFIDVQFLLAGEECMRFTPEERLGAGQGYNAEKDYELFPAPIAPSVLWVRAGQFALFHPGEGHQPGCAVELARPIKKIVVKIAV